MQAYIPTPHELTLGAGGLEGEGELTPPNRARSPSFSSDQLSNDSDLIVAHYLLGISAGAPRVAREEARPPALQRLDSRDAVDCLVALRTDAKRGRPSENGGGANATPATRRRLGMGPRRSAVVARPPEVQRISSASVLQLKQLAAAYKLCPAPSATQLQAIAARLGLPAERLAGWWANRRGLEAWAATLPAGEAARQVRAVYGPATPR